MAPSADNVYLFYPNLVGYARIALGIVSCACMSAAPVAAATLYFLSAFLDAFDGHLARAYGQSSRFGAMLDQLTDRLMFMALLMALGRFYPRALLVFQLVAIVDIASHWLHLHAADLTRRTTHKASANALLHRYYTSKPFLFAMCAGNEAFYGLLYVAAHWTRAPALLGITLPAALAALCAPIALVKSAISVVHLVEAAREVVRHDVEQRRKAAE